MKKIIPIIISLFLLASCGESTVAKVGKIKITEGEFGFYLDSIKTQMQGTELETDSDWETQEIEGKKAIDVAKERAMENAIKNALYIEAAKAYGYELDVDDKVTIGKMKTQLINGYGGKNGYKIYLEENNITDKFIDTMLESSAFQNKIRENIAEENPVTDEEIDQYFNDNYEEVNTRYRKAKHILFLTTDQTSGIPLIKSERDKAKRQFDSLKKRIDQGEDFDALMHEFSEDPGLLESPDGYLFKTGEMVPEFEGCVDSLAFDQIGDCESEYGYHIVKRLSFTVDEVRDMIREDILIDRVDELVEKWASEYGVEIVKFEKGDM